MKKTFLSSTFFASLCLAATIAQAQTVIDSCPKNHQPAVVDVLATVSTNLFDCPLLEERNLRNLVNKHFPGTVFAYPIPGTCVSGSILEGSTITFPLSGTSIDVSGFTESAQRFFPEALAVSPANSGVFLSGVSSDGIPFVSGAAATIVSLEGVSSDFDLDLVLSDRFTVELIGFPFIDTEDFEVVGARGASATGRLTGIAQISGDPSAPLMDAAFSVRGQICIK